MRNYDLLNLAIIKRAFRFVGVEVPTSEIFFIINEMRNPNKKAKLVCYEYKDYIFNFGIDVGPEEPRKIKVATILHNYEKIYDFDLKNHDEMEQDTWVKRLRNTDIKSLDIFKE